MKTSARDRLTALLASAPRRRVLPDERIVVLSDLHMGDGGRNDDFVHNGPLCLEALEHFYLAKGFTLILNGDIEELLRNTKADIVKAWKPMYDLFDRFRAKNRLVWLQGNHEILPAEELRGGGRPAWFDGESLLLDFPYGKIFLFHGHQAGVANSGRYNGFIGWSLKFFANSLGIGNRSIAHDSVKKFKLEKAVHEFSRAEGLVSVIGHTHRPLFESLSKKASQAIRIDKMCRDYTRADAARRIRIRTAVRELHRDLLGPSKAESLATAVYGEHPVPCVFNSGCAVGKRGFTTLEIKNGKIALVFWSSPERSKLPVTYNENRPSRCFGEGAYRTILRREALDYVFSRIQLLGGES